MINDRITELIGQLEMNANSFADTIGVKSAVIYNIVKGRRSKPSFEVLQKILMAFQAINANWLLRGEGDLWKEENEAKDLREVTYDRIEERVNFLINEIKAELPNNYSVEELHELVNTLIDENINQKFKIISLYEKQDQIIDLLRKKLSLNI